MTAPFLERDLDVLAPLTWGAYLALPFETRNMDLVDGRIVVNSPGAVHELVLRRLSLAFELWAQSHFDPGEMSTQQPIGITNDRGYQPDLAWWPESQCSAPDDPLTLRGLPSIVLEVLSPSTRRFDLVRKRRDYEAIGIAEFWTIDPITKTAALHRRSAADPGFDLSMSVSTDGSISTPLLPGFEANLASLFRRR